MKLIQPFLLLSFLFTLSLWSATPVPYSGKIDIRGVNYFGDAQFAFSLHDGNGTTHWRNGNQPKETIKVTIRNGRYSVLLGGQGMNSLPPELFLNHDKLYLKVEVDMGDEEGLRHLAPDQLITATPRALVADLAKVSEVAKVAEKVGNGAITRDMLSSEVLAQLDANATVSPSAPVTITRDMLHQDVRDDLNKTVTITRNMLPADVLSDLNRTITKSMLGSDVLDDLNKSSTTSSPITLSMLAPEVTAKLDQNVSVGGGIVAGSLISVPYGQSAPAGYSLYQQGEPIWNWQSRASLGIARQIYDGATVIGDNIYVVGGWNEEDHYNLVERYDDSSNTWTALDPLSHKRGGVATSVLNGKLYAFGGAFSTSVEAYDPVSENWSSKPSIPRLTWHGSGVTFQDKIYFFGGNDASSVFNQVICFDEAADQWIEKESMLSTRELHNVALYDNLIWLIGGKRGGAILSNVESYNPLTDSWKTEAPLMEKRSGFVAWVANGKIYVGGGSNGQKNLDSIEVYDPSKKLWSLFGKLPTPLIASDAVILNNKVYVIAGHTGSYFSNKVYAADLNASVEGVYDLYRKDGNASAGTPLVQAEVADGSVTASKLANNTITTSQLNEQILKYLKPEITAQPQAQTVYGDTNASFSVTAEGKFLTYQWKKDGSNLTSETNSTLNITDANATLHDGNYSVVVSNDFGRVESGVVELVISSWSPLSLSGLKLWLDAKDTNSIIRQSSKISAWNDKSGNLNNATQSLSDKQPNFSNGQVIFDGLNDILELPSMDLSGDAMVIFSYTPLNDSGYSVIGSSSNNDHWDRYNINGYTYANHFTQTRMTGVGLNFPKTGEQIVAYMADSSSSNYKIRFNGTTVHEFSQSFIFADNVKQIGGAQASGSEFNGKLDELIITDEFSLVIIQQIEGYLADKWGLTNNLPSNHPYKNNAP